MPFCLSARARFTGPQDVDRGVHVTVERNAARRAVVAFRLPRIMARAAARAILRRVAGVHFHEPATGPFCLVRQLLPQETPRLFLNRSVQPRFGSHILARFLDRARSRAGHVRDAQLLDGDGAEAPHQVSRDAVAGVAVADGQAAAHPAKLPDGLAAVIRPALAGGHPLLLCGDGIRAFRAREGPLAGAPCTPRLSAFRRGERTRPA